MATRLGPAPVRVPMFDPSGQMRPEWLRYFQALYASGGLVETHTETITEHETTLAYDSPNGVDVWAVVEESAARLDPPSGRDVTPEIEAAQRDTASLPLRDSTGEIEAALRLTYPDALPSVSRAELDELQAVLAMADPAPLTNLGSAAYADTSTFAQVAASNTFTLSQTFSSGLSATVVNATSDSASVPSLAVGSGGNADSFLSVSGGRAIYGYDVTRFAAVLQAGAGKGFEFWVNPATNGPFVSGTLAVSVLSTGNLALKAGLSPNLRTATTATDTATATDHTLILTGVTTQNLPATPTAGQLLYLVNTSASSVTVSGNGKNIWQTGTTAASITLAANATLILQWDSASATNLWRVIK